MKKTWIVLAMAAALCAACDDSKDEAKCVENSATCSSNGQRLVCTDGVYVAIDCPAGRYCDNGSCLIPPAEACVAGLYSIPSCAGNAVVYCSNGQIKTEECPAGFSCTLNGAGAGYCAKSTVAINSVCRTDESRCNLSGEREICQNGAWVPSACGDSLKCFQGECVECEPGAVNCKSVEGSTVVQAQHCSNGVWETVDTCDSAKNFVCRGGVCYDNNICKSEGAVRCGLDGIIQTCTDGAWTTTNVCNTNEKCYAGGCYSSDQKLPGDACDVNTAEDSCLGNSVLYCDDEFVADDCGKDSCASIQYTYTEEGQTHTENLVKCYSDSDICEPGSPDSQVCMLYSIFGYVLATTECLAADNGKNYYVATTLTAQCPNGCDGNNCKAGGSNPSGGGDDTLFECNSESYDGNITVGEYCQSTKGNGYKAYCVACAPENFGCFNEDVSGQHAGTEYCGGSTPTGGGDDTLFACGSSSYDGTMTVDQYCQSTKGNGYKAYCITCAPENFGCFNEDVSGQHAGTEYCGSSSGGGSDAAIVAGAECSAADLNKEQSSCGYDSEYGGYFTDYYECIYDSEYGYYWYYTEAMEYDACNGACNADGTSCDSKGSTTYPYQ